MPIDGESVNLPKPFPVTASLLFALLVHMLPAVHAVSHLPLRNKACAIADLKRS